MVDYPSSLLQHQPNQSEVAPPFLLHVMNDLQECVEKQVEIAACVKQRVHAHYLELEKARLVPGYRL